MDIGQASLGASTAAALALAICFLIVVAPGTDLTTNVSGGGVCGTYPEGATSASAWFLAEFQNDTGHGVQVRDVRAVDVHDVSLSRLSIAPAPNGHGPGLVATNASTTPAVYGRTVPVDSGVVVPAHGTLDVVGRMVLHDGVTAGQVRGLVVTTAGPLGTTRTVTDPESFGVGIGSGHDEADIGCPGT